MNVTDPVTKKPIVARHFDIRRNGNGFKITVYGATGHMGAIRERDGAITKMAHLLQGLIRSRAKLCVAGGAVNFELFGMSTRENLVLEGGQGFLPTHEIQEVMSRMRLAAQRGAENYLRRCHRGESGEKVAVVTFDKLHNAAFDGESDSPTMRNASAAAKTAGLGKTDKVSGWTVSCDARLFATEYPGMPVLTFGPGELAFAHSDQEQIALNDIQKAAGFLALFLLRQTGTLANI
jgi:acetylornithine deacetylase/succinyl-diaminopimelate desuccinylase-like protein